MQVYDWFKWHGKNLLLEPFSLQCSVACGQGIRTRSVKCLGPGIGDSNDCPQDEKPAYEEVCDMGHCATGLSGSWFFTEWTQHVSNFLVICSLIQVTPTPIVIHDSQQINQRFLPFSHQNTACGCFFA